MTLKDHHREIFIPEHKTKNILLRWLANNVFHTVSMWFFHIALNATDKREYNFDNYYIRHAFAEFFGFRLYKIFDYPYSKWGTYYKFDSEFLKELKQEMSSSGWDDYDDNGIPYWYYLWSNDEETGDGWRLIPSQNKNI